MIVTIHLPLEVLPEPLSELLLEEELDRVELLVPDPVLRLLDEPDLTVALVLLLRLLDEPDLTVALVLLLVLRLAVLVLTLVASGRYTLTELLFTTVALPEVEREVLLSILRTVAVLPVVFLYSEAVGPL